MCTQEKLAKAIRTRTTTITGTITETGTTPTRVAIYSRRHGFNADFMFYSYVNKVRSLLCA